VLPRKLVSADSGGSSQAQRRLGAVPLRSLEKRTHSWPQSCWEQVPEMGAEKVLTFGDRYTRARACRQHVGRIQLAEARPRLRGCVPTGGDPRERSRMQGVRLHSRIMRFAKCRLADPTASHTRTHKIGPLSFQQKVQAAGTD
jgi:hypothetical protein